LASITIEAEVAMGDFAELQVWRDPGTASALSWYRDVAENRRPAKFRIAATVPAAVSLKDAPEEALWRELDRLTPHFLERWRRIRDDGAELDGRADQSLLDLCRTLAWRMLAHCNFCRWNCQVDRTRGAKFGACKLGAATRVSTYFHHPGEELVYRGGAGSGTIFFTSCNMRCAFCQNGDISTDKDNGKLTDARTLAAMAWRLRAEGCHNVNWVGGEVTIHLHTVVEAIALLGKGFEPTRADLAAALPTKSDPAFWYRLDPERASYQGTFNAPMLWNSNFFMTDEAMRILRLLIDVWLPDFKFGPGRCAMSLAKTPWYWETVTGNLLLLRAWGENLTVRHLVMPGHVACCSYPVLDWIAAHMPEVPLNVMDQYRPDNFCDPHSTKYRPQYAAIARRPTSSEIQGAYRYADRLGLNYKTVTFDRHSPEGPALMPGI
jgi:putative pyruvate formate lyase activating enzyme